ncbi:hypothetical protein [Domibacillus enclensis]|uniref:Uncharacterized protein n=1 Tax=Domibacillus enclensis TaxID=1017273 RepID=A0A1N6WGW7_9BACI|nr:hypothetical protein [Domibacillus enclensis]OXS77932.1 hypothetical protein B1B05_10020 [Domibacillus enclensis]SIQ89417.1 hypothetical protein SAMN05443094_104165 [Domibacillus enclensis]
MINKGDTVSFAIGNDKTTYTVTTGEYELLGRKVVNLKGYSGEVAIEYLKIVNQSRNQAREGRQPGPC